MLAIKHFLKLFPLISRGGTYHLNGSTSIITKASHYSPSLFSPFGCFHLMSTMKGRNMRSKVEKRMWRESAKTQMEHRRSKRIHKMLMSEDERLIYSLRRMSPCTARAVLDQLVGYFQARLASYPTTLSEDEAIVADSQLNPKKRVAARLVYLEKKMLNACTRATIELIEQLPDHTVSPCPAPFAPLLK